MDQPTAEHALQELEVLVGHWIAQATWPSGDTLPGACTFEWLPTRAHLIQLVTIDHPEAPDSTAIIGCDAANGTYTQLYSDERGVSRIYQMSIANGEWKLWRDGEPFAQRFIANISADGNTITGRWEIAEDGATYKTDFDLTFSRAASPPM